MTKLPLFEFSEQTHKWMQQMLKDSVQINQQNGTKTIRKIPAIAIP